MLTSNTYPISARITLALTLVFFTALQLLATDYTDAWAALHRNDRATARKLFMAATKDPKTATDAYLSLLVLDYIEEKISKNTDLVEKALKNVSQPEPYLFALWYSDGVAGPETYMSPSQLEQVKSIIANPKTTSALRNLALYRLGDYYQSQSDFEKRNEYWQKTSNLRNWQLTGPFDNQSECGFDKNYPPITEPKPDAKFKSMYNADINWFTPAGVSTDCWVRPSVHIRYTNANFYAQTFVTSNIAQEAILGVSYSCTGIKVWVNDRLVVSDKEKRKVVFDLYRPKIKLNKGVNRIVVQTGRIGNESIRFNLQLLDASENFLTNIQSSAQYQTYTPDKSPEAIEQSEYPYVQFFYDKLAADPDNSLHAYLAYLALMQCDQFEKALVVLNKVLEKHPKSSIFRNARRIVYYKLDNETEETQERQFFINEDPNSLWGCIFRASEAYRREDWDEARKIVEYRADNYADNEDVWQSRVQILSRQNKMDEILELVEKGSQKFPKSMFFADIRFNIATQMENNPKAGIKIYEKMIESQYSYSLASKLKDLYFEQGMEPKGLKILEKFYENYPDDPTEAEALAEYYYNQKDPKRAEEWIKKALVNAPFDASFYQTAANIAQLAKNDAKELEFLTKSLNFFPNSDEIRARIRELEGKKPLYGVLPIADDDLDQIVKAQRGVKFDEQYPYVYLLDDYSSIVFSEKNSEDYRTMILLITNEKGVESWKETSIGYNGYSQRLIFEKTLIIKANGAKTEAERNDNDLVFTNLAVGDAVVIQYKLVNYISSNRMSREYVRTFGFNGDVPVKKARFAVLVHKDVQFAHQLGNANYEMQQSVHGDFKRYVWQTNDEGVQETEKLMPPYYDAYKSIAVSTIKDWSDVANWYADLSLSQAKVEYEVKEVIRQLFPNGYTQLSETERAKIIYNYVVSTIKYSSVPFRQSGLIPQKAARVIQTKLGDCKDLSTLYATIGREVGLRVNLILVNTSNNGKKCMPLPSIDFNHCIVKVVADQQDWYLELTDKYLPFGSLGNSDITALILEIPYKAEARSAGLVSLNPLNRTPNVRRQKVEVKIEKRDIVVAGQIGLGGAMASEIRHKYLDESKKDIQENIQNQISRRFENTASVKEFSLGNLIELKDTIQMNIRYTVKNEVLQIGEMGTLKVPFFYSFVTSDVFPELEGARKFPIYYRKYEDADRYEDEVAIVIPTGKQFTEIPANVSFSFDKIDYKLEYIRESPQRLLVRRTAQIKSDEIAATEYDKLRQFVEEVVAAEQRYVVFK
jgi:tetratricopeptide (TPR) repeat protein